MARKRKNKNKRNPLFLLGGLILIIIIISQLQSKEKDVGIIAYFYDENGNLLDTARAKAPGAPMFAPVCPPDTDCNQDPIEIPSTTAYVRFVLTITNTGTVDGDFTYMGATLARDTGGSPYSYGNGIREGSQTISIPAGGGTGIFSTKRQGCTVDPGVEECGFDITLADPGDATNYNYITFEILGQFEEAGGVVQESTRYFEFRFYKASPLLEIPVGTIAPWLKSMVGTPALPAGFVECNGQVLSDADSPYNGQTLPNLNGNQNILRGASTSGGTQSMGVGLSTADLSGHAAGGENYNHGHGLSASNNPIQYNVVYIIKIK